MVCGVLRATTFTKRRPHSGDRREAAAESGRVWPSRIQPLRQAGRASVGNLNFEFRAQKSKIDEKTMILCRKLNKLCERETYMMSNTLMSVLRLFDMSK